MSEGGRLVFPNDFLEEGSQSVVGSMVDRSTYLSGLMGRIFVCDDIRRQEQCGVIDLAPSPRTRHRLRSHQQQAVGQKSKNQKCAPGERKWALKNLNPAHRAHLGNLK
jgi:hypothetical protein